MHVFVEPSIQAWASGSHVVMVVSSWMYVNAQTTVTIGALRLPLPAPQQQLLLRAQHVHDRDGDRADRLHRLPDRAAALHARSGASSTASSDVTGMKVDSGSALGQRACTNLYAAVPSMHVAFALMIGWSLARLVAPQRRARAVVAVPVPDGLRDRRDRQPLHRRRDARRPDGGRLRVWRDAGSRGRDPTAWRFSAVAAAADRRAGSEPDAAAAQHAPTAPGTARHAARAGPARDARADRPGAAARTGPQPADRVAADARTRSR